MITHLLNSNFIISRFVTTSGDKMTFSTVTGISGQAQPLDNNKNEIGSGLFGKSFKIYFDGGADVQEGDLIRNTDTNEEYRVATGGVSRRTMGSIDFLLVAVEKT